MKTEFKPRSRELIEVGYFLSRFTDRVDGGRPLPPQELGVSAWGAAYDLFYSKLSGGRPLEQFRYTLKNSRDEFDGFLDNGRQGWKESDGRPQRLNQKPHVVFQEFRNLTREQIWARIRNHISRE